MGPVRGESKVFLVATPVDPMVARRHTGVTTAGRRCHSFPCRLATGPRGKPEIVHGSLVGIHAVWFRNRSQRVITIPTWVRMHTMSPSS